MTPAPASSRTGIAGLAATAISIACTVTVAAAGPSLLEPSLPGGPRQPPWTLEARLGPYLAVGLAAAGLAAGTIGLALTLRAMRLGWTVRPRYVLLAGVLAAVVAGTTGPFGSSDFISYAAYGRELVTGHNPYLVAPQTLARLGDPVARAVQDWAGTPSVYGALATGVFGLASLIGGTSVRLTVFVLDIVNVLAFAGTGVLLDRMARGAAARLRAAVLWTCNPLLLQVLVAGSHVDGLAAALSIGGIAVLAPVIPNGRGSSRPAFRALAAGVVLGLGFAVKPTVLLVAVGLAIAIASPRPGPSPSPGPGPGPGPDLLAISGAITPETANKSLAAARHAVLGCLVAGFAIVATADLALIGRAGIAQTFRASGMVSVGSPWRVVRTALSLFIAQPVADEVVRWCAVALAVVLAMALLGWRGAGGPSGPRWVWAPFALVLAWLVAWPYVLPWYDALGWALLPLLAASDCDWLLLVRTAALGFGYLPARSAGITIPSGLRWMEPVIRSALTPAVLAAVAVLLAIAVWRSRRSPGSVRAPRAGRPASLTGARQT